MNGPPLRVGMVGAGGISGAYLSSLPRLPGLALVAVADLDTDRARAAAHGWPAVSVRATDELLAADDVDVVLNLTIPAAHADVTLAAIAAGKHVYGEKPLAASMADADAMLDAARAAAVRIGCAPDTVLGTGTQTARRAIEDGAIGVPVAATAFMTTPGHESWHHNPEFYYQPGGGPLLDMGPYYLSSLVHLLGPIRRVTGFSSRPQVSRTVGSGPKQGTTFDVRVDTHVTGVLEHAGGALSTILMSFDVWAARLPRIEVYGTAGSLSVPDPNTFGGTVELFTGREPTWRSLPDSAGYSDSGRGYGLADLARALDVGRPHRASAELAAHVLDVMESLLRAGRTGEVVTVSTSCQRPELVPPGLPPHRA